LPAPDPSDRSLHSSLTAPGAKALGEFFRSYVQAMNAKDAAGIAALCAEDVVWDDSALMGSGPLHGRVAVRDFFDEFLFRPFPDLRFEVLEVVGSGDGTSAAERARFSGTFMRPATAIGLAPTRQPTRFDVAAFFEFRQGKAAHVRVIVDMLDIARQTGAVPIPGTIGDRVVKVLQHLNAFRLRRRRVVHGATKA
jgi:predicted ester cyclase